MKAVFLCLLTLPAFAQSPDDCRLYPDWGRYGCPFNLATHSAPPSIKPDRSWHLLIVTWDGKVTLMKNLTKSEAEQIRGRMLDLPYTKAEKAAAAKEKARVDAQCEEWNAMGPSTWGPALCINMKANYFPRYRQVEAFQ